MNIEELSMKYYEHVEKTAMKLLLMYNFYKK